MGISMILKVISKFRAGKNKYVFFSFSCSIVTIGIWRSMWRIRYEMYGAALVMSLRVFDWNLYMLVCMLVFFGSAPELNIIHLYGFM